MSAIDKDSVVLSVFSTKSNRKEKALCKKPGCTNTVASSQNKFCSLACHNSFKTRTKKCARIGCDTMIVGKIKERTYCSVDCYRDDVKVKKVLQ